MIDLYLNSIISEIVKWNKSE